MKVCMVGLGYIGLPTALMMARSGVSVVGVDKKASVVETLSRGKMTFQESGLLELYQDALRQEHFLLSTRCEEADVYIIAVATPYIKVSKKIDPSGVITAVKDVLEVAPDGAIIAVESTVSPGTIDQHVRPIINQAIEAGRLLSIAHVPERIIPGNMIFELVHNSRTIGTDDEKTADRLKELYGKFCKGELVSTDIKTAEMAKVVENTYRDINIAFANELAKMCHRAGMDVHEIIRVANKHPRVNILSPGPGVGGHCISVDPWFLVGDYPDIVNIIREARRINDGMPEYVLYRVSGIMEQHNITDISKVGFYGLTYKENVDDTRESPTLQMIDFMNKHLAHGARFYDPMLSDPIVEGQEMDFDEFLDKIELLVIMVGHEHIKEQYASINNKIIFDTRNCLLSRDIIYL